MGGPKVGYVQTRQEFFKLLATLIGIRLAAAYVTSYFFFGKGIGVFAFWGVLFVGVVTMMIPAMFAFGAVTLVVDVLKRRRIQYKGAFTLTLGFLIATHALGLPYLLAWKVLFEEPPPSDASVPDPYPFILSSDIPGVACIAVAVLIALALTVFRRVARGSGRSTRGSGPWG